MSDGRRKVLLMTLAALVPIAVMVGVVLSDRSDGGASRARTYGRSRAARKGSSGRRLQSTYDFATQLEMTVCLVDGHTSQSATSTAEQWKTAIINFFDIENDDYVQVDDSVTKCTVDDWQRRVSIYNEGDDSNTAADVASEQVDLIYPNSPKNKTDQFFESISETLDEENEDVPSPLVDDFDLYSLGFLIIWLDSDGDVLDSQGTTENKDVVSIGGTDVWWPWWAWLIYAAVVVCCICPMLFFFFKWRRDNEAETADGQSQQSGKEFGTPAAPSITSTNNPNPYGAGPGEEYKTGKP